MFSITLLSLEDRIHLASFTSFVLQVFEYGRSQRTVYNDTSSTFQELLQRNRSVSIHHKNISPIMKTFFDFRENRYNSRKFQEMRQQKVRIVRWDLETGLSALLNNTPFLFKSKIKDWETTECPYKLCKTYLKI